MSSFEVEEDSYNTGDVVEEIRGCLAFCDCVGGRLASRRYKTMGDIH